MNLQREEKKMKTERRGEVRDEERDIWNTHKVIISYLVIARRINVTRFTFSHF